MTLINELADAIVAAGAIAIPILINMFKKQLDKLITKQDEIGQIREEIAEIRQEQILANRYRLCQLLHKLEQKIESGVQPSISFVLTLTEQYNSYIAKGGNGELKKQYDELLGKLEKKE